LETTHGKTAEQYGEFFTIRPPLVPAVVAPPPAPEAPATTPAPPSAPPAPKSVPAVVKPAPKAKPKHKRQRAWVRSITVTAIIAGLASASPALAVSYPPPAGTAPMVGVIHGSHGTNVRLVYRLVALIESTPQGWREGKPEPEHRVRLDARGRFSVNVPACAFTVYCNMTYEAWAAFKGQRCSQASLFLNMTVGEPNEVLYRNQTKNPPVDEPLTCTPPPQHHTHH
jgi:hypothetical protein